MTDKYWKRRKVEAYKQRDEKPPPAPRVHACCTCCGRLRASLSMHSVGPLSYRHSCSAVCEGCWQEAPLDVLVALYVSAVWRWWEEPPSRRVLIAEDVAKLTKMAKEAPEDYQAIQEVYLDFGRSGRYEELDRIRSEYGLHFAMH